MAPHIPKEFSTRLIDWSPFVIMGKPIAAKARPKGENVVDLMDALKRNIANKGRSRTRGNAAANQREARCES